MPERGRKVSPCKLCGADRPPRLRASVTQDGKQRRISVCKDCLVGRTPEAKEAGIDGRDYRRGRTGRRGWWR